MHLIAMGTAPAGKGMGGKRRGEGERREGEGSAGERRGEGGGEE